MNSSQSTVLSLNIQKYDEGIDYRVSVPSIGFEIYLPQTIKTLEFFACIKINLNDKTFHKIGKFFEFDVMFFCVFRHWFKKYLWFCVNLRLTAWHFLCESCLPCLYNCTVHALSPAINQGLYHIIG